VWQALRGSLLSAETGAAAGSASGTGTLLRALPRLWTGLGPTFGRDVPFSAIYWGLLEPIRSALLPSQILASAVTGPGHALSSREQPPGPPSSASYFQLISANLLAGSLAGAAAAAATTPFDVIKTRMQLGAAASTGPGIKQPSSLAIAKQVLQEQGVRGLFVGIGPRMARCAPGCAIVICSYELLKLSMA